MTLEETTSAVERLSAQLQAKFGDDFESWDEVAAFAVGYLWALINKKEPRVFRARAHGRSAH